MFAAVLGTGEVDVYLAVQQDPACELARFSTRHRWGRALARLSLAFHCNIWGGLRPRGAGYSVHSCATRERKRFTIWCCGCLWQAVLTQNTVEANFHLG